MDFINQVIDRQNLELDQIRMILDDSLADRDFFCKTSRQSLMEMGLSEEKALTLMALYKSKVKYGYKLSLQTITHLFDLSRDKKDGYKLKSLIKSPFFLVKSGWLYEHAPYFLFFENDSIDLDSFIFRFAGVYDVGFLKNQTSFENWQENKNPKRIRTVSFWENKLIDPVSIIEKVMHDNLEGLELSIDFHPFNYSKLLPEEISQEKREEIRRAVKRSGVKIDIHSPIVGPYSPSPDPKVGKQLFFDPLNNYALMSETIQLAKDIGAGSVVIHLTDNFIVDRFVDLILGAADSDVRITIENYCQLDCTQNSDYFIEMAAAISEALPSEVKRRNFGLTVDVGHFNIEGEDPLIPVEKIGRWSLDKKIFLRLHATDNYGRLLFSPPHFSADVHGNVSGRGINNAAAIKILRSLGHEPVVVAEQINPLSDKDIELLHGALTQEIGSHFDAFAEKGSELLSSIGNDVLITPEISGKTTYKFLAGMEGISSLREHLVYRKIQDKKYLSVDEVKKISMEFMRMPAKYKQNMIEYLDNLLLPVQTETGSIQKNELDLICQNISGAIFGSMNSEHLERIFSEKKHCVKGEIICRQDTAGREMYLIKEGEVEVTIDGNTLAKLRAGEIFGEISLFYNLKRTASIRAKEDDTILGVLNRERFEALLRRGEPYSYDLVYRLYNILPDRLRNLNEKYKTAISALRLIHNGDSKRFLIVNQIDAVPISGFSHELTPEEVKKIFRHTRKFDTGSPIFSEGDKGDGAYYILKGSVNVVTKTPAKEDVILGKLGQDEIFGEMALIDEKPRSANVLADTHCEMAFIHKKDFDKLMESKSDLGLRMMSYICLSLFRRILRLDKMYSEIKNAFV